MNSSNKLTWSAKYVRRRGLSELRQQTPLDAELGIGEYTNQLLFGSLQLFIENTDNPLEYLAIRTVFGVKTENCGTNVRGTQHDS